MDCRFAFCAEEFGGNLWRMLIFGEQLEEWHIPHFEGAQSGKWFEELEEGGFKAVEDGRRVEEGLGIALQSEGLDPNICLKIRLPIMILASPQSFGFLQKYTKNPMAKFVSLVDPSIQGNILFDIAHLEQTKCNAFVSLRSFTNSSSIANENQNRHWSICSPNDIIDEKNDGQCKKHQKEEEHFEGIFVCWKMENDLATFISFDSTSNGANRIKSANHQLKCDVELGEWYKIEYCRQNDAIIVLNIQPAEIKEKMFRTRKMGQNGVVQFEVFIRKRDHGFETYVGAVKVFGLPAELQEKLVLIEWCNLEEKLGQNVLVFGEESDGENQSQNGQTQNKLKISADVPIEVKNANKFGGFGRGKPKRDLFKANLAKVDGKYSDLDMIEDEPNVKVDEGMCGEEGGEVNELPKINEELGGNEGMEGEERRELDEAMEIVTEIAIPEYLIGVILKEEGMVAKREFDCILEMSTESLNGIQIVGGSRDSVVECAKRIKAIRDKLIAENGGKRREEEMPSLEEKSEEMVSSNEEEEDKTLAQLLEFHSQHQGANWVEMLDAEKEEEEPPVLGDLTERMPAIENEAAIECVLEGPKGVKKEEIASQKIQLRRPPLRVVSKVFGRTYEKATSSNAVAFSHSSPSSSPPTKKVAFSLPNCEFVRVPKKYHQNIVGKDGNNLKRLERKFDVKIEIPVNWRDENISIWGNDSSRIGHCKEDILEMIGRMEAVGDCREVEDCVPIPVDDEKHNVVDYVKFLIGKEGSKMNELRANLQQIKIIMPYPEKGDAPIIRIIGLKEEVEEAKKHFNVQIEKFRNQIDIFVEIEEKHHEMFLNMKGQLMRELREQHPECTFFLNRNENRMEIRGILEDVQKAKEAIYGIIGEKNRKIVFHPELNRVLRELDVKEDALAEMMQHLVGGSRQ